ncbi:MAG: monovalent cation/H(+) antiporter subunit G [Saprospiraceae bacterium]|nr:monovalent cation/H(+) antiporter subunit G [Saprospiraceae bacterium]
MTDWIILFLMATGVLFILLAAVGIVRMPDLYLRISVTTKAATLGTGLVLMATAWHFQDTAVTARILAIILFIFLTAPVGAHLIGRASYFVGVPMWRRSVIDQLEGRYEKRTHKLSGGQDTQNVIPPEKDGDPDMESPAS